MGVNISVGIVAVAFLYEVAAVPYKLGAAFFKGF